MQIISVDDIHILHNALFMNKNMKNVGGLESTFSSKNKESIWIMPEKGENEFILHN